MNNAIAATPSGTNVVVDTSIINAITTASPVVQLTLLLLIGLSVLCWAVGYSKWQQLTKLEKENIPFLNFFWKAKSLEDVLASLNQFPNSSLARVFKAAYIELRAITEASAKEENLGLHISRSDNLERTLRKAIDIEIASMESRLNMLATTGSTGPFIGLFGTVWGIMSSFHKIGATGNASLAVVAPGISEALVATAIGLAAAIPAVVLYNHFVSKIKREETALNNFAGDFLNLAKLHYLKD
jgi:biopolymer transport protein TolQ